MPIYSHTHIFTTAQRQSKHVIIPTVLLANLLVLAKFVFDILKHLGETTTVLHTYRTSTLLYSRFLATGFRHSSCGAAVPVLFRNNRNIRAYGT